MTCIPQTERGGWRSSLSGWDPGRGGGMCTLAKLTGGLALQYALEHGARILEHRPVVYNMNMELAVVSTVLWFGS